MTDEHHPPALNAYKGIQGGLTHFEFNPDDYRHHLEGTDLTLEQQDELLRVLFDIMRQFVDWGFNLHPVQAAQGGVKPAIDVVSVIERLAEEPAHEEQR